MMNDDVYEKLVYKPLKSWSGVIVITVVMRPDKFSCPYNCYYCPNEPGQPRSYLSNEPAIARANEVKFDAVRQMYARMDALNKIGHKVDKLEIIVLGGTFSTYSKVYQEEFIRDLYYAANTFGIEERDRLKLEEEQKENEETKYSIIGISLETRPDQITKYEIKRLRRYGCTRVQLGVQHTNNDILEYINRGHKVEASVNAIKMLRSNGFKIDLHIMPDLPGSNPIEDKKMIRKIIEGKDYIPDYLKIYPCLDVDFTEIRRWKENGKWKPYAEEGNGQKIIDVVLEAKRYSKKYIRFNRIQRDFCESKPEVLGYKSKNIRTNFRQMLQDEMKRQNLSCECIRCHEVKNQEVNRLNIKMNIEKFETNGGEEYFVSSNEGEKLLGFIRVRINDLYTLPLKNIPVGSYVHNIDMKPCSGVQVV